MRVKALVSVTVLVLAGCSKPETMIGLRCPVTIHYDNKFQGTSDRQSVEHYIVNIKDNSVTTYTDNDKKFYDACGNKPCKVTITDNLIRIEMDRRAVAGSDEANAVEWHRELTQDFH